ncbi:MAG TPA: hypothetical protein VEJ19_08565 [Nitrososphaerales archaeon]|nr:hypothetical protein [Nitrososphaerales archaeon]
MVKESYATVLGQKLFYKVLGEPQKGTIRCLQGGPGATHDYLLPLVDFVESTRKAKS